MDNRAKRMSRLSQLIEKHKVILADQRIISADKKIVDVSHIIK